MRPIGNNEKGAFSLNEIKIVEKISNIEQFITKLKW